MLVNVIFLVAFISRIEGKWVVQNALPTTMFIRLPLADHNDRFKALHRVLPVSFVFLGSKKLLPLGPFWGPSVE